MPLLDHFHPPLYPARHWESFHAAWASAIAGHLNVAILPAHYYAETQVHIGSRVEINVATLEQAASSFGSPQPGNGPVGTLTVPTVWTPPVPALVIPTLFPDEVEIQIFGSAAGLYLVAAIELVSPGNKDRAETRQAFAAKCSSYLQLGIGVVIVDVVTDRLANLHDELMRSLDKPETFSFPTNTHLYAVAYRPVRRKSGDHIECWPASLSLGQILPTVPLALRGGPTLPVDLESTYMDARRGSRL